MSAFIRWLKSIFSIGVDRKSEEHNVNSILDGAFARIRNVDPETHQQWLRLQRTIEEDSSETHPIRFRAVPYFASAAVVLALIAASYLYFFPLESPPEIFATGKGQQTTLLLRDSSEVTLSYATELVVHDLQPGKPRRISLKGEAYYRVRHNDTPFIVSTGYADVRVVGTEFNLRAREGKLEVAVLRGSVTVDASDGRKESSLLLSQNQMAVCERGDVPRRTGDIPASNYPGWLHGRLYLNKTSLLAACREIEMRFDVVINIEATDVHPEMTGVLEAKSAESAMRALCELTGKRFTHNGQGYTLY